MKVVNARAVKEAFADCIAQSQQESVVVTRYGQPVAVVVGVAGMDLEQVLVGADRELWDTVERRRAASDTASHAAARRALGLGRRRR